MDKRCPTLFDRVVTHCPEPVPPLILIPHTTRTDKGISVELAITTASDMSYLEAAIKAAQTEIRARAHDRGLLALAAVARLFRPGVDDGVTW